jgi:hypothetical protein
MEGVALLSGPLEVEREKIADAVKWFKTFPAVGMIQVWVYRAEWLEMIEVGALRSVIWRDEFVTHIRSAPGTHSSPWREIDGNALEAGCPGAVGTEQRIADEHTRLADMHAQGALAAAEASRIVSRTMGDPEPPQVCCHECPDDDAHCQLNVDHDADHAATRDGELVRWRRDEERN